MPSARLRGNVKPLFQLSNLTNGPTSIEPGEDLVSIEMAESDIDKLTFGDFASGVTNFQFEVEAAFSGDTGSLHDVLWKNAGRTGVTFVYGPHGNSVAAAGKPVYTGVCTIGATPPFTREASDDEYATFETTIVCDTLTRNTV